MTMGNRLRSGSARRGLAFISAAALLTSMMAAPAFAEHTENTTVLDADSAVEAALNWSDQTFDTSDAVIIGRDDVFADNLASGLIQGLGDGIPLLLTPTEGLDEEVAAEIEDLGATVAHVLGGDEAISDEVVEELEDMGLTIHRHAGETRVETAIDIASKHATDATEAILARSTATGSDPSQAFADSLAAGAWAAESGMPVLLTQSNELNDNLAAYLETSDITDINVVGGTAAISAAVVSELESMGIEVERVSGATRFETAVEIAEARGFDSAADADTVILSEGQQSNAWAGGFAAAAYSALNSAPIVLSNGEDLPAPTVDFLEGGDADLVCGPFVEPAACAEAAAILGHEEAPHTNQSFEATPSDAAVNAASSSSSTNEGRRTYTVSGLDDDETYRLELFPAENVETDEEGVVSFEDTNNDNLADGDGGTTARIETVNGDATNQSDEQNVSPEDGTLTFTIDATAAEAVVPVLWVDQETTGDNELDLNADDEPTEPFGVGGEKEWFTEADAGDVAADTDITNVDKENNFFDAGGDRYFYDSDDTFQINDGGCANVSQAEFENALSSGDDLDTASNYGDNDADTVGDDNSTLCIQDENPDITTGFTATRVDDSSVDIAIEDDDEEQESFNVYRAEDDCASVNFATDDSDFTEVASLTAEDLDDDNAEDDAEFTDTGLEPETTYCYVVTAVNDGDEGPASAEDEVTTTAAGETAAPTIENAELTNDAVVTGAADDGDVWELDFSEAMDAIDDGDYFDLTDADGDTFRVVCDNGGTIAADPDQGEATCDLTADDADTVVNDLTITITVTPADRNAAGDGTLEYPVTISDTDGIVDAGDGLEVRLEASDDVLIDEED